MWPIPGTARGATVDAAVDLHSTADAAADLDEDQVVHGPGDAAVLLAQGHDVDVVVDGDGEAVLVGEHVADRMAVPSRHDRRGDGNALTETHRAGQADPDGIQPREVAFGADLVQDLRHPSKDVRRTGA